MEKILDDNYKSYYNETFRKEKNNNSFASKTKKNCLKLHIAINFLFAINQPKKNP